MNDGNWDAPPPRGGLAGCLDRFVGPGATKTELALQFAIPILAAITASVYAVSVAEQWSWLQYAACFVLAFDIAGGIVTNATSAAKRWYHRAGQGFGDHFGFTCLHLIHLIVVSWLFTGFDIRWILTAGVYLLASSAIVLSVPHYLQRPVAYTAYGFSLLLPLYLLYSPQGLEWFLPLFYLKLLVSHLPKEEPYRPAADN